MKTVYQLCREHNRDVTFHNHQAQCITAAIFEPALAFVVHNVETFNEKDLVLVCACGFKDEVLAEKWMAKVEFEAIRKKYHV